MSLAFTMEVLYAPNGTDVSLSFMFGFPYSNNKANYKALIVGHISILHMRIHRLYVKKIPDSLSSNSTKNLHSKRLLMYLIKLLSKS